MINKKRKIIRHNSNKLLKGLLSLCPSSDRTLILFISGILALTTGACTRLDSSERLKDSSQPIVHSTKPRVSPQPSTPPESVETTTPQSTETGASLYRQALDTAYSAATISQSAQSADDWQLVISRWQEAIMLLESVSSSSPQYAIAQSKITEYKNNLNIAQQIAVGEAIQQNINVAIGGTNLEVGLLGQDFYRHYDVVIRENVVEFHQR